MSDLYRVAVTGDQFQAVLEAASHEIELDPWRAKQLVTLALSIKDGIDSEREWTMEDES